MLKTHCVPAISGMKSFHKALDPISLSSALKWLQNTFSLKACDDQTRDVNNTIIQNHFWVLSVKERDIQIWLNWLHVIIHITLVRREYKTMDRVFVYSSKAKGLD